MFLKVSIIYCKTFTYHEPPPLNPIDCTNVIIVWKRNMKKKTIKLNDESLLNALYMGLYQQMKLKGVSSTKYSIDRPKTVKP